MASNRPLEGDLTVTGMDQASQYAWMANVTDLINEVQTDHDADGTNATNYKTLLNLLQHRSQNFVIQTSPVLAIDTNFDVKNTEQTIFVAGGVAYTLNDNTSCDTGTTKTIATTKWGAFMVEAASASSLTAQWAASDYASEALALAAAKALTPTASKCCIGFVTVQAAGITWTAGTDALATGTGGTPANATNYYSLSVPSFTAISTSPSAALSNSTAITLLRA
jgi:hypothetical protein